MTFTPLDFYQLAARKAALSLEIKGLKRSGHRQTAYSICKSEYNLKGSRASVLRQMQALVDAALGLPIRLDPRP